jgi:hypothetical protein
MRYSDAFKELYKMSKGIELSTTVKYERVAVFLGRVFVAQGAANNKWGRNLSCFRFAYGKKDIVLKLVCGLTDSEWKRISNHMAWVAGITSKKLEIYHHNQTNEEKSNWIKQRHGWIIDLDTVRAFG